MYNLIFFSSLSWVAWSGIITVLPQDQALNWKKAREIYFSLRSERENPIELFKHDQVGTEPNPRVGSSGIRTWDHRGESTNDQGLKQ